MNLRNKKWISAVLAGALVLQSVPAAAYGAEVEIPIVEEAKEIVSVEESGEAQDGADAAAQSEEDLDYILGRPLTEDEIQEQEALEPELSPLNEEESLAEEYFGVSSYCTRSVETPSRYDLRESGLITSVKNQGGYDMCWAYSVISLAESSKIKDSESNTADNTDYSEDHLAYVTYNAVTDPLDNTEGDQTLFLKAIEGEEQAPYKKAGGNPTLAAMTLSQWKGAALEGTAVTKENAYSRDAILTDFIQIQGSGENRIRNMKNVLQEYGPLSVTFYYTGLCFNRDTAAYCYQHTGIERITTNHAVVIVGWDDNYSKSNFRNGDSLTSDGAWIVKNSYGSSWGDGGYFYMSYEDPSLKTVVAANFVSPDTYDHNYQYDGTAGISYAKAMNTDDEVASVYQVKGNSQGSELLKAVGYQVSSADSQVKLEIYKDLSDKSDPKSGTLVYESDAIYQSYPGYHTVGLEEPVNLNYGSYYSIVVRALSPMKFSYEINYESEQYQYIAAIGIGQSFSRPSGGASWRDNALTKVKFSEEEYTIGYCMRIKGYTEDVFYEPITLNQTSLMRKKGAKYTLKVSDETVPVVWSSSNTKVASVDDNGVVTATGYGKAVITAEAADGSSRSASCKVTVGYSISYRLNGGINAKANPTVYYNQKVTLKAPSRKGYLFQGWYTSSSYKTKLTYIDKGTKKNYTLYAKWKKIRVPAVKSVKLKNSSSKAMTVSYAKISGVGGYQIVYDTNSKFTTKKWVGRVGTSKKITGLKKGKTYYVKVRAFRVDSTGSRCYGPYSTVSKIKITR